MLSEHRPTSPFQEILRFGVTGVINTLTHTLTFVCQVELLGIDPLIASVPAFCLAVLTSYTLNRNWVFRNPGDHVDQFTRFFLVAFSGLGINLLVMYICLEWFHLHYLISLAVTVFFLAAWSYGMNKFWTFKS
ncbi:MAG: GtrA family protein [Leptospirales bacterium]|jgi:putative flippase GtrA